MKKVLLTLAAIMVSLSAYALDGQLILGNFKANDPFNFPVTLENGPRDGQKADATMQLQLFYVTGGSETALTPVVTFRNGNGAGTFANQTYTIPNFGDASGPATFRLKGFDTGTSYEGALQYHGISADFTATVNVAPTPATLTSNFPQNFKLQFVPEPSTIALAVLGGAALLFRRKK